MSGEMLVISFVCEVNHVIMAATLDRRQNQQIPLQTLQIICPFTHVMASVIHYSREPSHWLQSSVTRIVLHGLLAILKTRHLHAFRQENECVM